MASSARWTGCFRRDTSDRRRRGSPGERTCAGVGWGSGCGWQRSGGLGAAERRELNRIGVNLNQMARALPQPLVLVFLGGVREWAERIGRKYER